MRRLLTVAFIAWSCGPARRPELELPDASSDAGSDASAEDGGTCVPDSEARLCFLLGVCGTVDTEDNCGTPVRLECSACDGGEGDAGVCYPETVAETCSRLHLCGTVNAADNCGVTVRLNCPQAETGSQTCARLHLCGTVDAPNNCGVIVRLNCACHSDAGPVDAGAPDDAGIFISCDSNADCTQSGSDCDQVRHLCVHTQGPAGDCSGCFTYSEPTSFRGEGTPSCVPSASNRWTPQGEPDGGFCADDGGCPDPNGIACYDGRFACSGDICARPGMCVFLVCEYRLYKHDAGQ